MDDLSGNLKRHAVTTLVGFATGVLLGFLVNVWLEDVSKPLDVLYRWQTLATGVIALFVGLSTVFVILSQVKEQRRQFADAKERAARSSRAVASFALAELCGYAAASVRWAVLLPHRRGELSDVLAEDLGSSFPELPISAIRSLEKAAEYANEREAIAISELFEQMQIQNSRMRSARDFALEGEIGSRNNMTALDATRDQQLIDAAVLHAKASNLFSWSRRDREQSLLESSENWRIASSLRNLNVSETDYPCVWQMLAEQYPE
jgi:hypothetical protein